MNNFTTEKIKELNDVLENMIEESTNLKELGNYLKLKWIVNSIIDNEVLETNKKVIKKMIGEIIYKMKFTPNTIVKNTVNYELELMTGVEK